jgi:EAL domain-containing protein (putative c-di-GMP-specific phosphodiesterase class I)
MARACAALTIFSIPWWSWVWSSTWIAACSNVRQPKSQNGGSPSGQEIRLAVNVAAASFQHPDFVPNLINALARSRLPAHALDLEITESTALSDLARASRTLQSVRKLGVRVALDDFGVGYSSLAQLRDLPVQTLKIDRSFVRDVLLDERDAAIVRALIELAHSLGMEVIAEGVETEAQCHFLESAGCDLLQGYLFARPMPMREGLGLGRWQPVVADAGLRRPAIAQRVRDFLGRTYSTRL